MDRKVLPLGLAAVLLAAALWWIAFPTQDPLEETEQLHVESVTAGSPAPSPLEDRAGPAPSPSGYGQPSTGAARVGYAVALPRLQGLAPGTPPGTAIEIWVAWDPPITEQPRIQRLLGDAIVERILPPVVPDAPEVVMLSVPRAEISDLLWGDRYGALSATVRR